MSKGKIAFVVGHEEWGKSATLRALTDGNYRIRRTKISGVEFFIRRTSNDDKPETKSYINFMRVRNPAQAPYIIAALCPQFDDLTRETEKILQDLSAKGYQLFFWVIEHSYDNSEIVTPKEIKHLHNFGTVEVFASKVEATERANNFRKFVSNVVLH